MSIYLMIQNNVHDLDWRTEQTNLFKSKLDKILKTGEFGTSISIQVKDFVEESDENYSIRGWAYSNVIQTYLVMWYPLKKKLEYVDIHIWPNEQREGKGTLLLQHTETIAKELACDKLRIIAIKDSSLEFWKKKASDYQFDGKIAIKYFTN